MNHSLGTKDSFGSIYKIYETRLYRYSTLFSDGKEFNTARDKATILNNHFQFVFTLSKDLSNIPSYHSSVFSMPPIIISIEEIEALLTELDTNTSAGPDQIPSYI